MPGEDAKKRLKPLHPDDMQILKVERHPTRPASQKSIVIVEPADGRLITVKGRSPYYGSRKVSLIEYPKGSDRPDILVSHEDYAKDSFTWVPLDHFFEGRKRFADLAPDKVSSIELEKIHPNGLKALHEKVRGHKR